MAPLPNVFDDVDAPKVPTFPPNGIVLLFPENAVGADCWEFPNALKDSPVAGCTVEACP